MTLVPDALSVSQEDMTIRPVIDYTQYLGEPPFFTELE